MPCHFAKSKAREYHSSNRNENCKNIKGHKKTAQFCIMWQLGVALVVVLVRFNFLPNPIQFRCHVAAVEMRW